MNNLEQFFIEENETSLRLDQILALRFKKRFSRTYFQKLIDQGLVLINGEPAKKRISPRLGDEIEIQFALEKDTDIEAENIPLNIMYEDDDILVINKSAGLVIHPAVGNWTGTFVNALLYHCKDLANEEGGLRPGIVHRLDKDTSGVLIAAKNSYSQMRLIEAFSKREVKKLYLAITIGNPGNQIINKPIGRHMRHRQKMAIVETGRPAITHTQTVKTGEKLSFVRVKIETGRTHQIRVHLSSIGTPVLGDSIYGNATYNKNAGVARQMLHAECLELLHPRTLKLMTFHAPSPEDFERALRFI